MFIYVAALSVVFLAQSGVTAFIQAPAAKRATTRATWGGASKSDAAKHLAGPIGWDLGDDSLGWATSKDDSGGSPSDDPTPSMNLSDGDCGATGTSFLDIGAAAVQITVTASSAPLLATTALVVEFAARI